MKQENARRFYVSKTLALPLISYPGGRCLDEKGAKAVFAKHKEFTDEQGCYVFGFRAARGYKPIYVGKTTGQTLGDEALADGTVRKINKALLKTRRATLVVAFVVSETRAGACPQKAIGEIERVLIQYAYQKNPQIENENSIYRCGWFIDGVLNRSQGNPTEQAKIFRQLVGIPNSRSLEFHAVLKETKRKSRSAKAKK